MNSKFLFFALIFLFSVSSCGKYSDGPSVSFVSKEKRLCRTWVLEKIDHSNGYSTSDFYWKLTFVNDKSLKLEHKNEFDEIIPTSSTWDWLMGSYGLTITTGTLPMGLPSGSQNYEIKRLTTKELWIEDRGSLIKYYFKAE
jgi:hypothetical protein